MRSLSISFDFFRNSKSVLTIFLLVNRCENECKLKIFNGRSAHNIDIEFCECAYVLVEFGVATKHTLCRCRLYVIWTPIPAHTQHRAVPCDVCDTISVHSSCLLPVSVSLVGRLFGRYRVPTHD